MSKSEIGGRSHMPLAQHDNDENVGEEGEGQYDGHDVAVDGHRQVGRAVAVGSVDVVTSAFEKAIVQRMNLQ